MWKRFLSVIVIAGTALSAGETPPKYQPAVTLLEHRDVAARHAAVVYKASVAAADRQLIADADIAVKKAMSSNNLDGANELAKIKKDALDRIADEKSEKPATGNSEIYGVWKIRCQAGEWLWNIQPDKVTHEHSGTVIAKIEQQGLSIVLKWPDGVVERLTPANGRLLFESWPIGGDMKDLPTRYGVGERMK